MSQASQRAPRAVARRLSLQEIVIIAAGALAAIMVGIAAGAGLPPV